MSVIASVRHAASTLHLLLLDEPLADDLINRRFDKRCTDRSSSIFSPPKRSSASSVLPYQSK